MERANTAASSETAAALPAEVRELLAWCDDQPAARQAAASVDVEPRPSRLVRPAAWRLWAAMLVVALLLGLKLSELQLTTTHALALPPPGQPLMALEEQVIAPAPTPTVVILGSGPVRAAVQARQLEDELGLPVGSVLNLGMSAGSASDALTLYERNRSKLQQARWLVVAVDGWDLQTTESVTTPAADRPALEKLVALAQADGLQVAALQTPTRPAAADELIEPTNTSRRQTLGAVPFWCFPTGAEADIPAQCFDPAGQLTAAGAARFTCRLADLLSLPQADEQPTRVARSN